MANEVYGYSKERLGKPEEKKVKKEIKPKKKAKKK